MKAGHGAPNAAQPQPKLRTGVEPQITQMTQIPEFGL